MISIITPVYNRAYSLGNLYKSLVKQANKQFEWIVINDGSSDNTEELINEFIAEKKINIIYEYQQNSGKHMALNKAIKIAKGELIFFVDSDDYLADSCIEFIIEKWKDVKDNNTFAGISGSRVSPNGEIIGDLGEVKRLEYVDANTFEYRYKYKVTGDKAEVFRKEIIRKYMFPEFANEKFIPEALVYNRIAKDGYKLRWYREPIYVCEYRKDGLTSQGGSLFVKSWKGYSLYLKEMLVYKEVPFFFKLKLLVAYIRLSLKYKKPLFTIITVK